MKFNRIIEKLEKTKAISLAENTAKDRNLEWNTGIETIFAACCNNNLGVHEED